MRFNRLLSHSAAGVLAAGMVLLAGQLESAPQDPAQGQPPDLVAGLQKTPGCLGVEAGQMASGKQSIFAFFKDKASVVRWYYGETHQQAMDMMMPDAEGTKPLSMVDDEVGPILVIATLTMSDKPSFESVKMPISQISIELYKPLPGGAFLGGRLAPRDFHVEGMKDYTPPADDVGEDG